MLPYAESGRFRRHFVFQARAHPLYLYPAELEEKNISTWGSGERGGWRSMTIGWDSGCA